jgi:hypothetical protein
MNDYQNFVKYLTTAQRGHRNPQAKVTPPRAKPMPARPANINSDAILRREIISIFNGR